MNCVPSPSDEPAADLIERALHSVATEPVRRAIRHYFAGRGSGAVTPRRAIDPAELCAILPNVILIDARGGDGFTVRLAGTGFHERLGREITRTDWLDVVPDAWRPAMAACLRTLLTQPCGAHFFIAEGWRTDPCLEYALLPVSASGCGAPDMLFGAAAMIREPRRGLLRAVTAAQRTRLIDIGSSVPRGAAGE